MLSRAAYSVLGGRGPGCGAEGQGGRNQARINKEASPGFQATQAGLFTYEEPECRVRGAEVALGPG